MNIKLPMDLQYLYRNDYFDSVKLLLVLEFFKRRKKGVLIDEANYYFTLIDTLDVKSELISINKRFLQDVYLNNEIMLKNLVLRLINSEYVELTIEKMLNRTNVYLKISESGDKAIEDISHPLFEETRQRLKLLNSNYKYTSGNYKEVLSKNE